MSVNVLMWHEAVQIVFGAVSECAAEKGFILILFQIPQNNDDRQFL